MGEPILLRCRAQQYAWGKLGRYSLVYKYLGDGAEYDIDKPYAELWMGNHPNAPSLTSDGRSLGEVDGCENIPYLFKVLSIAKPLSIQAHPDKMWAKRLRAQDPMHYPDDNHKPEIALFVTPALLLYGIRDVSQIEAILGAMPSVAALLGVQGMVADVSQHFARLLRLPQGDYLPLLASVRVSLDAVDPLIFIAAELISGSFARDSGILFPLFLQVLSAQPGDAIYIPAGVPHAYLSGDLFEAMALSDNVVRAGLTPKFVDIDTLLAIVPWSHKEPAWVRPIPSGPGSVRYSVPGIDEFELHVNDVGAAVVRELVWSFPAITIVAAGDFGSWREGAVILTPPGVTLRGAAGHNGARLVTCTQRVS